MNLKHITTTVCPHCGCNEIVGEAVKLDGARIHRHTNGQQWETRTFACGFRTGWVPNFQSERTKDDCRQSDEARAKEAKRRAAFSEVVNYIKRLDVDDDFKRRLTPIYY